MDLMGRVESLMKAERMNRKKLAERSGIPYSTLCGMKEGKWKRMELPTLVKLADYFHVSLDWLVYGSERAKSEYSDLIDVAKLALDCSKAMHETADMTNVLGKMLIMLSHETAVEKEGGHMTTTEKLAVMKAAEERNAERIAAHIDKRKEEGGQARDA